MELNAYEHNAEIAHQIAGYGERIAASMKSGHSLEQCQRWLDRAKELQGQLRLIPSCDY